MLDDSLRFDSSSEHLLLQEMSRASEDCTGADFPHAFQSFPVASEGRRRRSCWKSIYRNVRCDKGDHSNIIKRKAYVKWGLLILLVLVILGGIAALVWFALVSVLIHRLAPKSISNGLTPIVANWHNPNDSIQLLSPWPTADFSRGIVPIPMHSHNDETRSVPLFEALASGCISIEADTWLEKKQTGDLDLLVGHAQESLKYERTLRSLYLDPLKIILQNQNAPSKIDENGSIVLSGVYGDTSRSTRLVLLLDIKSNGTDTWPTIMQQLDPLRQAGWLTFWNGSTNSITERPLIVVGTGNTPFESVVSNTTYRDVFFDAPLANISNPQYDASNSYTASISLEAAVGKTRFGKFSSKQLNTVQTQISQAKAKGLVPRYWDTVAWPISSRNNVWSTLVDNDVGLLNVDDVREASRWDWSWCVVGGLVLC